MLFSEGGYGRDGVACTDTIVDLPRERNEVIKLRDVDIERCFEEFMGWGITAAWNA